MDPGPPPLSRSCEDRPSCFLIFIFISQCRWASADPSCFTFYGLENIHKYMGFGSVFLPRLMILSQSILHLTVPRTTISMYLLAVGLSCIYHLSSHLNRTGSRARSTSYTGLGDSVRRAEGRLGFKTFGIKKG